MSENFILTNQILTREINDATNQDQTIQTEFLYQMPWFLQQRKFYDVFLISEKTRQHQLVMMMMSTFFEFLERFFYSIVPPIMHCHSLHCCVVLSTVFVLDLLDDNFINN